MKPLSLPFQQLFGEMGRDRLELHVPFEAAGNGASERQDVLNAFDELTREGVLDTCGGAFYALAEKGKRQLRSLESWSGTRGRQR